MLNTKIYELCVKHKIDPEVAYTALFILYHEFSNKALQAAFEDTLSSLSILGIFKINYSDEENKIEWLIPLYGDSVCEDEWTWVTTEYMKLFKDLRKDAGGAPSANISKMKKFFASHPSVRKDDIIDAAKLYIQQITDVKYLQRADYFILKGKVESRLEEYLLILKERKAVAASKKENTIAL